MKMALLLCGELRTFDNNYVIKGFDKLRNLYNFDVYVSAWDHRGISQWSVRQNFSDQKNRYENINIDYVKEIFKTNNVKLYNYDEWDRENEEFSIYKNKNIVQYNATFALSFLRKKSIENLIDNYDVITISRPDSIFTKEPPNYFFNGDNIIWHQGTIDECIYSTFISSSSKNIIKLCNWYGDYDNMKYTLSTMKKFEHGHILYKYIEKLGIKTSTYKGMYNNSLFCEPFRTEEYLESKYLNMIKEHLISGKNIGMDFDKKWYPFYE